MKIDGKTIILNQDDEIIIKVEKEEQPIIIEEPEADAQTKIISFDELLSIYNNILSQSLYKTITTVSKTYGMLQWAYIKAKQQWDDESSWMFNQSKFPDLYDWRAPYSKKYKINAFNSLEAWLFAMLLSELVCDKGVMTNTQTLLFDKAYQLGGGKDIPIYGLDIHADPMHSRLIAGCMYSYVRSAYEQESIDNMRNELGGSKIPGMTWNDLQYKSTAINDSKGLLGYTLNSCGYLVNTTRFLPGAAGPYAENTERDIIAVGDKMNKFTRNYVVDEEIDKYMVENFNLCADSSEEEFRSYSPEKQLVIMNAVAAQRATKAYFFGSKKVKYTGKSLQNGIMHHRFVEDPNGVLVAGPFANVNIGMSNSMRDEIMDIADNSRFPTFDTEFGRCRPCGGKIRPSSARSSDGSRENGMYNIDMSCIFASNEESRAKWAAEDGLVKEKPKSYPSGHSTQTMAMAFILAQKDSDNIDKYVIPAYELSVVRTVARMHWNSDIIYGRLFATMIVPIINAMEVEDYKVKLIIKNETGKNIQSTGEIRLYVDNHIGINTYLPNAAPTAGALYTFKPGENNFSDKEIYCKMNGSDELPINYRNATINEIRFYDYRHYNNIDAGFNAILDTSDPRCSTKLKSGSTFVIKITNK